MPIRSYNCRRDALSKSMRFRPLPACPFLSETGTRAYLHSPAGRYKSGHYRRAK
jgi:hypothetical protein